MPSLTAFRRSPRGARLRDRAGALTRLPAVLAAAAVIATGLAAAFLLAPGEAEAQINTQIPQGQAPAPQGQAPQGQAPQGQAPSSTKFGDWAQRCTSNPPPEASPPPPGKQEVCFLVQQVVMQNQQRPVLTVTIGYFGQQHQPLAILDTQLRVPLAHGIRVGVDGKEVAAAPFEFCHRDGCRAFLSLDDKIVNAFKAGKMGAIQMRSSGGDAVNLPMSLNGFTAGYTSLE